jgi:uncharacterized protein YcfJ
MQQPSPEFWYGVKLAYTAAGLRPPQESNMGAAGGTAAGALAGTALGSTLGDLIASQTKEHIFNIPIPGTQSLEDSHGRLLGGALGAALGGYTGHQMGQGYDDQQRSRQAWLRQLQARGI